MGSWFSASPISDPYSDVDLVLLISLLEFSLEAALLPGLELLGVRETLGVLLAWDNGNGRNKRKLVICKTRLKKIMFVSLILTSVEFALDNPVSGVDSPREFCLERTGPVLAEATESPSSDSSRASLAAAASAACSLYLEMRI